MSDPQKLATEASPDGEYTSPAAQLAFRDAYARGYAQAKSDAQERLAEAMQHGLETRGYYILIRFNHRHRSSAHNSGWQEIRSALTHQWKRTTGGHINSCTESPHWYEYKGENVDYDCTMLAHVEDGVAAAFLKQNGLDALLEVSGLKFWADRLGLENLRLEYRASESGEDHG